jgi:hypothetical protein
MNRLGLCCSALFASVLGCEGSPAVKAGNPVMDIDGAGQGQEIVFRFSICGHAGARFQTRAIRVYRAGEGPRGLPPVCEVLLDKKAQEIEDAEMNVPTWKYGSVPPGWTKRRCEALVAGDYEIHVTAAGSGVRWFSVGEHGNLEWKAVGSCRR